MPGPAVWLGWLELFASNNKYRKCSFLTVLRESSFNMTRGGGDEDIEGGLRTFVYFKPKRRGGGEIEPLARGATKLSSFEFQYLHPAPLVILNELSLITPLTDLLQANHQGQKGTSKTKSTGPPVLPDCFAHSSISRSPNFFCILASSPFTGYGRNSPGHFVLKETRDKPSQMRH